MPEGHGLYALLPVGLQHLACSVAGWRLRRQRFDARFWRILGDAEERGFWTSDELTAFRDDRLSAFVAHSAESTEYYAKMFQDCGLEPQEVRSLGDLANLPILAKAVVQDGLRNFRSRAVPRRELIAAHTSGTTGGGLRFFTTRDAIREQWAVWWRYRRWHGIPFDAWCGYFGGRSVVPAGTVHPPFWRYNVPMRQILFSGYHMSPDNLKAYVLELRRSRPPWLHGYPSLLSLLAAYLLDSSADVGYEVQWITTGAENLLAHQKELIRRAFGVQPRQHYGLAEGVANFSECEAGSLHVDEDFSAVEFVPDHAAGAYRIIGTNFTNAATPLIRYDTGDLAQLKDGFCSCGRPGRVVESVDGRQEDYVILPNGVRIGRLDHVFKDLTWVREAQIVQRKDRSLEVRLVPRVGEYRRHEGQLLRELRQRVGREVRIEIAYVDFIERTRTGKLRFVVSEAESESSMLTGRGVLKSPETEGVEEMSGRAPK